MKIATINLLPSTIKMDAFVNGKRTSLYSDSLHPRLQGLPAGRVVEYFLCTRTAQTLQHCNNQIRAHLTSSDQIHITIKSSEITATVCKQTQNIFF